LYETQLTKSCSDSTYVKAVFVWRVTTKFRLVVITAIFITKYVSLVELYHSLRITNSKHEFNIIYILHYTYNIIHIYIGNQEIILVKILQIDFAQNLSIRHQVLHKNISKKYKWIKICTYVSSSEKRRVYFRSNNKYNNLYITFKRFNYLVFKGWFFKFTGKTK